MVNLHADLVWTSALVNSSYVEQDVSPHGTTLRVYDRDHKPQAHIRIDFADGKVVVT